MRCWICGAQADSAEHRIKKADIVRTYGRGPYRGDSAPFHVREGVVRPIPGPGSQLVKYRPSLCQGCNSSGTQRFDKAYDRLISWVMENESTVLRNRMIDFADVYGSDFETQQRRLFKYFVKSLGCRLVDAGRKVPRDLVNLLPRRHFATRLAISFAVNEDVLLLPSWRSGFIGKGDLFVSKLRSFLRSTNGYQWNEHVSWFTICYWYATTGEGNLGNRWIADARFVYLGRANPLTPEQREEVQSKVTDEEEPGQTAPGGDDG